MPTISVFDVSDLYGFAGADSFVIRIDRLVTDAVYL
jgi:hypothetical protein